MKISIICFALILLLSSCKSLDLDELNPKGQNQTLLPPLEPVFDIYHVDHRVDDANLSNQVINPYINDDTRDRIAIFESDVYDNITSPYGERKGSIHCIISSEEIEHSAYFLIPSFLSLGILNILGMPFDLSHKILDVKVEIYDLDRNLVGRYSAQCRKKTIVAFYYGYSGKSADRKNNIQAFKCAMNDIKAQINNDAERLIKALN